jgi:4-carboxymuconolactone decarboxylase
MQHGVYVPAFESCFVPRGRTCEYAPPERTRPLKKSLLGIALCAAAPFTSAADAQDQASKPAAAGASTQQITRGGEQASTTGPAVYFTRRARVDPLFPANEDIKASGAYVTFEPGARSAWHTPFRGAAASGDVGRGPDAGMGQARAGHPPRRRGVVPTRCQALARSRANDRDDPLTVTGTVDGKSVTWMEKVTDDQYHAR